MRSRRRACLTVALAALCLAVVTGTGAAGRSAAHPGVQPGPAVALPVTARLRGPNDPHAFDLSRLVPRSARLRQVWYLHGGRRPDQVLVEWARGSGQDLPDDVPWGLTLWTQAPYRPANFEAPWQGVAIPHLRVSPTLLRVALADVTGDGHPDVLVEQYPHTNHGCGPHRVFATLRGGTTWRVFRASLCETTLRGSAGLLALDLPVYERGDSVCCWSKVEKLRLRWTGRRYVTASDRIVPVR